MNCQTSSYKLLQNTLILITHTVQTIKIQSDAFEVFVTGFIVENLTFYSTRTFYIWSKYWGLVKDSHFLFRQRAEGWMRNLLDRQWQQDVWYADMHELNGAFPTFRPKGPTAAQGPEPLWRLSAPKQKWTMIQTLPARWRLQSVWQQIPSGVRSRGQREGVENTFVWWL